MPWKNWQVHILPFPLTASACLCGVLCGTTVLFLRSVWFLPWLCSLFWCWKFLFALLIFSFLLSIFNYGIICSFGDKEGLKNFCIPSLGVLSGGTEAVASLIMPQTPLILKRTWNFEQNNNQNKNPNPKIAAFLIFLVKLESTVGY